MEKQRIYFCVDMKSFFASVECAECGLNSFQTNFVVADGRGCGMICLAITPAMKVLGVKNCCRLFEIPKNIKYITAMPHMRKYIEYNADIYDIPCSFDGRIQNGIDAITAELAYEQKLPEGLLTGVENGGFTNTVVTFEGTDECGNQTTYEFEIEKSVNGWLIAFIIIDVLVLAGGVTVFILKKKEII